MRPEVHFVVTCTSRPKRVGERDGVDYIFVTKRKFEKMIGRNELLEHCHVYGDYKGIPKKQVGKFAPMSTPNKVSNSYLIIHL